MMVLLGTLQGNGSANSLSITNIPTSYSKILVKGVCRVTSPISSGTPLFVGFANNTNINSFGINSFQTNVTTWGTSGWNNQSVGRTTPQVPGTGSEAGRMLNFELDIPNRNAGINRLPTIWSSSSVSASGPQHSEISSFNLQSTSQVTGLTFTNGESGAWSTNTIIHVYGIN